MSLIQDLVSPSKYDIKCPYPMEPWGHCIHNTANDAPAENEANYMKSNNLEVSFHVAVDHAKSIQLIPFNRNAWAAGDGGKGDGNRHYIHWEICYSKSGGNNFLEAEKRCAKEIAADLKRRGWGIDRVRKHQDFSGKYCPHRTLDMGYNRIIEMIKAELGNLNGTPAPDPTPGKPVPSGAFFRVVAGSYSERANAERTQDNLKASGYDSFLDPVVAKDGKTYLRVIVGSFKERKYADERMNKLIADGYQAFVAIYESNANDTPTAPPEVSKPTTPTAPIISVGSKVNIVGSKYATGQTIPAEQKGSKVHTVMQITGNRVLLKEIYSWVYKSDVKLAGTTTAPSTPNNSGSVAVGSKVNITASHYSTGQVIPAEQKGSKVHTIMQITGDKALLQEIYSWVPLSGLKLAGTSASRSVAVGSKVRITGSHYATGQAIPSEQKGNKIHTVQQISGDRALLKEIYSWVYIKDIYVV